MFSTIIAIGIIIFQLALVIGIIGYFVKAPFMPFVSKYAPVILGAAFIGGTLVSFIYQYGFGYEPCLLCWYQRIFIIPIAILSLTGDIHTNKLLRKQILILATIGFVIALFHNYIDIFPTGLDVCGTSGVSCLRRYVYEFDYITIPMMSATVLLSGIMIPLIVKRYPQAPVAGKTL